MKSKNKINLTLGQKKVSERAPRAPTPMRGRAQTFYTDLTVHTEDSTRLFEVDLGTGGKTDRKT